LPLEARGSGAISRVAAGVRAETSAPVRSGHTARTIDPSNTFVSTSDTDERLFYNRSSPAMTGCDRGAWRCASRPHHFAWIVPLPAYLRQTRM